MTETPNDTETQSVDPVNQPEHYKKGGIETIDVLQAKLSPAEFSGFCIGNALKYLTRRHYKGKAQQDLEKAHWYLTRALGIEKEPAGIVNLNPDPKLLDAAIESLSVKTGPIRGAPLITEYPTDPVWECIQPGCLLPRTHSRLYCEKHTLSTGKSMDKEVPGGK